MKKQEIEQFAKLVEEAATLYNKIALKYAKNYDEKEEIVASITIKKQTLILAGVFTFLSGTIGTVMFTAGAPLIPMLVLAIGPSLLATVATIGFFPNKNRATFKEKREGEEAEDKVYKDFVLKRVTADYEKYVQAHKNILPFIEKIKSSIYEGNLSQKDNLVDKNRIALLLYNVQKMYKEGLFKGFNGLEEAEFTKEDIPRIKYQVEDLSKEEFNSILENKEELKNLLEHTYDSSVLASLFMRSNVDFSKTFVNKLSSCASDDLILTNSKNMPNSLGSVIVCMAREKFNFSEEEKFNILEFMKKNVYEDRYLSFLEEVCIASRNNSWRDIAVEEYTERKNRLAEEKALLPPEPATKLEKETAPTNIVEAPNVTIANKVIEVEELPENTFVLSFSAFMKNVASFTDKLNVKEGLPNIEKVGENLLKNIQIIENNKDFLSSEDKIKYSILTKDNFQEMKDLWRRSQGTSQEVMIRSELVETLGTIDTQLEQIAYGIESSLTRKIKSFALYQKNKTPPKHMSMGK